MSDEGNQVSVIGAGGLAKEVIAALRASDYEVVAAYDDEVLKWTDSILGIPILPMAQAAEGPAMSVLAISDNAARQRVLTELELEWLSVVHPFSWVAPSASLGLGAIVCAGAVVQPDTVLGQHTVVEAGAIVGHDVQLEDFVRIGIGARIAGAVWIGEGSAIGAGAVVTEQRRIGAWSLVGDGVVVGFDVADGAAVVASADVELRLVELEEDEATPEDSAPPGDAPEDETRGPTYSS